MELVPEELPDALLEELLAPLLLEFALVSVVAVPPPPPPPHAVKISKAAPMMVACVDNLNAFTMLFPMRCLNEHACSLHTTSKS